MGRIILATADRVATLTICAPPVNSLTAAMRAELAELVDRLVQDDEVRAIVLQGEGSKAFCAGFDLAELASMLGSIDRVRAQFEADAVLFDRLARCPKPTIAVVEGLALGGGLELAVCCDFILAGEGARFGLPEIKLGAFPGGGGTVRVTRQIGPARAKEMILLGEPIDAATALAWGLVTSIVPNASLAHETMTLARTLADGPALAMQHAKRAIAAALETGEAKALALARESGARLAASADLADGVRSFLERERPSFRDRIDRDSDQE